MTASLDEAREVLRRTFGHADFRGLQGEVIGEVLAGRSTMAVLPTGGGKSLCYQIPSLLRPGVGLVVSPLIALMTDQVAALQQSGVAAARLDSNLDPAERTETCRKVQDGERAAPGQDLADHAGLQAAEILVTESVAQHGARGVECVLRGGGRV